MDAPVYVQAVSTKNFIGVKGPLEFFYPEDLERLTGYEAVHFSKFSNYSDQIRKDASALKKFVMNKDSAGIKNKLKFEPNFKLEPAPFEIADMIFRNITKIWSFRGAEGGGVSQGQVDPRLVPGAKFGVELFFVTIFVDELCGGFHHLLEESKKKDGRVVERALLRSSWTVFLALHFSYMDLNFLLELRDRVFRENLEWSQLRSCLTEVDELVQFSNQTAKGMGTEFFDGSHFKNNRSVSHRDRVSKKFLGRLERIEQEIFNRSAEVPSIFGLKGFLDA
jgi:hypothetical protein